MQTNHTTSPSATDSNRLREVVRFGIVGAVATLLQYGLYVLLNRLVHPTLANTIAYALSFAFNYVASTRYTFQVKSTARRGLGFAFSHLINYTLQTVCLNLFVGMGLTKQIAMLPTLCVCIPVNFLLVRFFMKK